MQDVIAYILIQIPFFYMIVMEGEELHVKQTFIKYFILGIVTWIIGYLYFEYGSTDDKWLVYFGSQSTISYLLLFNLFSFPFRKIYKRNPDIAQENLSIETLVALLILMGTILIPYFLDTYLIKYAIY